MKTQKKFLQCLLAASLLFGSRPLFGQAIPDAPDSRPASVEQSRPPLADLFDGVPADWTKATQDRRLKTGERMQTTLIAPPKAERAEVNGWLSYGFRITIVEPAAGEAYDMQNAQRDAVERLAAVGKGYDKVEILAESDVERDGAVGHMVVLAGTKADKISEPELAGLLLLEGPKARVLFEISAPLSEEATFLKMLGVLRSIVDGQEQMQKDTGLPGSEDKPAARRLQAGELVI